MADETQLAQVADDPRVAQLAGDARAASPVANAFRPTVEFELGEYEWLTANPSPEVWQQNILNWQNFRDIYTIGQASDPSPSHLRAVLQASALNGQLESLYMEQSRIDIVNTYGEAVFETFTPSQKRELAGLLMVTRLDAARNGLEEYINPITKQVEDLHCEAAYDIGFVQGFVNNDRPTDNQSSITDLAESFENCVMSSGDFDITDIFDAGRNDGAFARNFEVSQATR